MARETQWPYSDHHRTKQPNSIMHGSVLIRSVVLVMIGE